MSARRGQVAHTGTAKTDAVGGHTRLHLLSEELPALRGWLVDAGHADYRAGQLVEWIYCKGADTLEQMTNLPQALRGWLAERADIGRARVAAESAARAGTI